MTFQNKVTGTIIEVYAEMAQYYERNINWRKLEGDNINE